MSPKNFAYWLQGLFEDGKVKTLDAAQVKMVKEHLGYVFEHIREKPRRKAMKYVAKAQSRTNTGPTGPTGPQC